MEDILTRLRNGENADAIATELTNAMNSALEAHKAEVAAKEAEAARAKREAEQLEEEKLDYFVDIVDCIVDFIKTYFVKSEDMMEIIDKFAKDLDYKLLLETIEKTVDDTQKDPMFQIALELLKREAKDSKTKVEENKYVMPKPVVKTTDKEDFDAVMKDFFKTFGI